MAQGGSRWRQLQRQCSREGQSHSPSKHCMDVTSVREPGWLHPVSNATSESLLHFPKYSHVKVLLLKHLLLKASHHLELMTNQFWFIHINLTMGKTNGVAGLSLMFGTLQLAPVPCLLPASCIGISFYLLMKKSLKKIWHEKYLTCTYQLRQCYCYNVTLQDVLGLSCLGHSHSPASSLATPFLLLPPPRFAVTRAGKLLSRGKVPAAQVPWPKAVVS